METKHTPGPWEAGKAYKHDANSWFAVVFAPAKTGKYHAPRAAEALGIDKDEATANAHLIAAAPDLLAACLRAKPYLASLPGKYGRESAGVLDEIKVAIAKATD